MRVTNSTMCRIVPACAIVFLAAIAGCSNSGSAPGTVIAPAAATSTSAQASAGATAGTSPAGILTQTFPDGTKVALVSAVWTALSQYDQAPYGVKFTFRIVAGPRWSNSAKVHLCANCGDQRPDEDYMVTIAGWAYPASNSTGYADLASTVTTAQGATESFGTDVAAWLSAGDSVSTSSTLIPPSSSPGEQPVTVTIEMPDTTLASETFMVNVTPNPNGSQA